MQYQQVSACSQRWHIAVCIPLGKRTMVAFLALRANSTPPPFQNLHCFGNDRPDDIPRRLCLPQFCSVAQAAYRVRRGSKASRKASPIKLMLSTVIAIMSPGGSQR